MTAIDFLRRDESGVYNEQDIAHMMIEFAKGHCKEQAETIKKNITHDIRIDWVDPYDYSAGHNGITGDIDYKSIDNAYSLSNIK